MYIRQSVFFSSDILQTRSDFGKYPIFGHIPSTKNLLEYKLRKSKNRFRYFYGQYLIAPNFLKNVFHVMDINGMIKMQTGPKMDKMEVKNEKLPILRPIFHLIDCKSINGQKNGCTNKTIPNIYFERYRWAVGALKHAKRAKCG